MKISILQTGKDLSPKQLFCQLPSMTVACEKKGDTAPTSSVLRQQEGSLHALLMIQSLNAGKTLSNMDILCNAGKSISPHLSHTDCNVNFKNTKQRGSSITSSNVLICPAKNFKKLRHRVLPIT